MIEVSHLTKIYGDHYAIRDLNFKIEPGRIYGFLGPNGAGKSTTMNIMTGCLAATEGHVSVDGHDIFDDAEQAKKLIGYLPELPPLYTDMTPREYLEFVAKAKGVARQEIEEQVDYVLSVTKAEDVENRLIRNLSKGYRQRIGIAQALLGHPEVIILDEPTVGLDPLQIIEIRDLIRSLGKEHTVILSSHILSEVQAVCDSIMIISHGRLVASDTSENLERMFTGTANLELVVKAEEEEIRSVLGSIEHVREIDCQPGEDGTVKVSVKTDSAESISEAVFFAFADIRKPILSMNTVQVSLEQVFLELTSGETQTTQGKAVRDDLDFFDDAVDTSAEEGGDEK